MFASLYMAPRAALPAVPPDQRLAAEANRAEGSRVDAQCNLAKQ